MKAESGSATPSVSRPPSRVGLLPVPRKPTDFVFLGWAFALICVSIALVVAAYAASGYTFACAPLVFACSATLPGSTTMSRCPGQAIVEQSFTFPHGCANSPAARNRIAAMCYSSCNPYNKAGVVFIALYANYINWRGDPVTVTMTADALLVDQVLRDNNLTSAPDPFSPDPPVYDNASFAGKRHSSGHFSLAPPSAKRQAFTTANNGVSTITSVVWSGPVSFAPQPTCPVDQYAVRTSNGGWFCREASCGSSFYYYNVLLQTSWPDILPGFFNAFSQKVSSTTTVMQTYGRTNSGGASNGGLYQNLYPLPDQLVTGSFLMAHQAGIPITLDFNMGTSVTSSSTYVHMHGFHFVNAPWFDGTKHHQPAIKYPCSFRYEVTESLPGTYWWHSHDEYYEQGTFGPIIIKDPNPPASAQSIQADIAITIGQHTATVTFPNDGGTTSQIVGLTFFGRPCLSYSPGIINGAVRQINLAPNVRTRLRLINAMPNDGLFVWIQDSAGAPVQFSMIEMDAAYTSTASVTAIHDQVFNVGVRLSILVSISPGTYRLYARTGSTNGNPPALFDQTGYTTSRVVEGYVILNVQNGFGTMPVITNSTAEECFARFENNPNAENPGFYWNPSYRQGSLPTTSLLKLKNISPLTGSVSTPIPAPSYTVAVSTAGLPASSMFPSWSATQTASPSQQLLQNAPWTSLLNSFVYAISLADSAAETNTIVIRIANSWTSGHPMHLHGHDFQVLEINDPADQPPSNPGFWASTVTVPGRGSVTIAVRFHKGLWLLHCHMVRHANQLVYAFVVSDPQAAKHVNWPLPAGAPLPLAYTSTCPLYVCPYAPTLGNPVSPPN